MDSVIVVIVIVTLLIVYTECSQYCEDLDLESTTFSPMQSCDDRHIRKSLKQNMECKPRPVIMRLPWPNNTDVQQMSPSYIEVYLCDGACHSQRQGCVPSKVTEKKIPVMLAKCGISTGQCSKECAYVTIEEHTDCMCACEMVEEDCESDAHHFLPDTCQCECKDSQARRDCLDQGRSWSEQDCSCGCPSVHTCSSGSIYSNTTCSCNIEIQTSLVPDQRVQRSNKVSFFSWEHIVILILLLLVLVMLAIIFTLISKIQSCSRKLASSKTPHTPLPTSNCMQLPPTKTERKHLHSEEECHPQPSYSPLYGYSSKDMEHIDSLPDPACHQCLYQDVGMGGASVNVDSRTLELGEAVRLLQNSMAK
eukprot:GFUD01009515.1.p1 GENE.GFUD01009515.1~~GFUD01009515.1.p1  ORF type:complete len:364 (+),score=64.00 GFUD01009515.1:123-1214(+)